MSRSNPRSIITLISLQEYQKLKDELEATRYIMIGTLPYEVGSMARKFVGDYAKENSLRRLLDFVADLIKYTSKSAFTSPGVSTSPRTYCPLCNGGSDDFYVRGFSIPIGLERHLLGRNNSHQCAVMSILLKMAQDRRQDLANGIKPRWGFF